MALTEKKEIAITYTAENVVTPPVVTPPINSNPAGKKCAENESSSFYMIPQSAVHDVYNGVAGVSSSIPATGDVMVGKPIEVFSTNGFTKVDDGYKSGNRQLFGSWGYTVNIQAGIPDTEQWCSEHLPKANTIIQVYGTSIIANFASSTRLDKTGYVYMLYEGYDITDITVKVRCRLVRYFQRDGSYSGSAYTGNFLPPVLANSNNSFKFVFLDKVKDNPIQASSTSKVYRVAVGVKPYHPLRTYDVGDTVYRVDLTNKPYHLEFYKKLKQDAPMEEMVGTAYQLKHGQPILPININTADGAVDPSVVTNSNVITDALQSNTILIANSHIFKLSEVSEGGTNSNIVTHTEAVMKLYNEAYVAVYDKLFMLPTYTSIRHSFIQKDGKLWIVWIFQDPYFRAGEFRFLQVGFAETSVWGRAGDRDGLIEYMPSNSMALWDHKANSSTCILNKKTGTFTAKLAESADMIMLRNLVLYGECRASAPLTVEITLTSADGNATHTFTHKPELKDTELLVYAGGGFYPYTGSFGEVGSIPQIVFMDIETLIGHDAVVEGLEVNATVKLKIFSGFDRVCIGDIAFGNKYQICCLDSSSMPSFQGYTTKREDKIGGYYTVNPNETARVKIPIEMLFSTKEQSLYWFKMAIKFSKRPIFLWSKKPKLSHLSQAGYIESAKPTQRGMGLNISLNEYNN